MAVWKRSETNEQERTEKKVKMSALIQELGKRVDCREMGASECSAFIQGEKVMAIELETARFGARRVHSLALTRAAPADTYSDRAYCGSSTMLSMRKINYLSPRVASFVTFVFSQYLMTAKWSRPSRLPSLRKPPRLLAKELIPSHCQGLLNRYHFALPPKNARTSMARCARKTLVSDGSSAADRPSHLAPLRPRRLPRRLPAASDRPRPSVSRLT
ncbi:unnamed protein product [Chrysodeixis includens]|uniref:Uncharacterized protein n=1 Tax=Chrysodeixis includens TaxID=689277 RepID=A0A9N8KUX1_CHRIL|nr:unnamed protein product [Chrysodeixis includens]